MGLPFLKPQRRETGLIVETRKPDGIEEQGMEGEDPALEAAAEDILRAITAKDAKHLALAMKAAFDIMESSPHEEAGEEEPESKEE